MRLIDADTLMPLFIEKAFIIQDRHGVKIGENWLLNYDDIKDVIDKAPTVLCDTYAMGYQDGVRKVLSERPQGEWIFRSGGYYNCDKCGEVERAEKNFCPNCGAKMEVEPRPDNIRPITDTRRYRAELDGTTGIFTIYRDDKKGKLTYEDVMRINIWRWGNED